VGPTGLIFFHISNIA
jgi:hypothetical protein